MTSRVATVIRCADRARQVYTTVESVLRQTATGGEVVLVTDETTPAAALDWLEAFAKARGLAVARAASAKPGAVRNAGVRATTAPFVTCLDAGDLIERRSHELMQAALEKDSSIAIATSWVSVVGIGVPPATIAPAGADLTALLGSTDAIHEASVFRRADWNAAGGFDESLQALDTYDFWLRVLARERQSVVIGAPLLIRPRRDDSLYRRSLDRESRLEAIQQIAQKHATLFTRDPAGMLEAREHALRRLGDDYKRMLARRDAAVRDLESLKVRAEELAQNVTAAGANAVDLGDFNRTTPISREWGYERGRPIDRYYIEAFLEAHAADVRGVVLEVQEGDYTRQFGADRVTRSDVLDLDAANSRATIVSDLRRASNVPASIYDCVIVTQTLHVIDDMRSAIAECARMLKPDGVLLATLPCASRVCIEYGYDGDFWRVTEAGARRLFAEVFPLDRIDVTSYGNVLVNAAFLYGLACEELSSSSFAETDPYFPLLVGVRASKGSSPA
jgi:SAM-dependent methyltransferase